MAISTFAGTQTWKIADYDYHYENAWYVGVTGTGLINDSSGVPIGTHPAAVKVSRTDESYGYVLPLTGETFSVILEPGASMDLTWIFRLDHEKTDNRTQNMNYSYTLLLPFTKNTKPVIEASDLSLAVGDDFDPFSGVSAKDSEDGELTSAIEVISNDVDPTKAGSYHVSYRVVDAVGEETLKTITVTVTEKPVISASDQTVVLGETFDPLKGVTAIDKEDGDLTAKIKVISNNVDTSKAGTYQVSYEVTDNDQNTVTKTITVVVNAPASNTKPVITASDQTLVLGETFDSLKGVSAADKEDGDLTAKIKVLSNNVNLKEPGSYNVIYVVIDSDGNRGTCHNSDRVHKCFSIKGFRNFN